MVSAPEFVCNSQLTFTTVNNYFGPTIYNALGYGVGIHCSKTSCLLLTGFRETKLFLSTVSVVLGGLSSPSSSSPSSSTASVDDGH